MIDADIRRVEVLYDDPLLLGDPTARADEKDDTSWQLALRWGYEHPEDAERVRQRILDEMLEVRQMRHGRVPSLYLGLRVLWLLAWTREKLNKNRVWPCSKTDHQAIGKMFGLRVPPPDDILYVRLVLNKELGIPLPETMNATPGTKKATDTEKLMTARIARGREALTNQNFRWVIKISEEAKRKKALEELVQDNKPAAVMVESDPHPDLETIHALYDGAVDMLREFKALKDLIPKLLEEKDKLTAEKLVRLCTSVEGTNDTVGALSAKLDSAVDELCDMHTAQKGLEPKVNDAISLLHSMDGALTGLDKKLTQLGEKLDKVTNRVEQVENWVKPKEECKHRYSERRDGGFYCLQCGTRLAKILGSTPPPEE